jgi:hypothetical protein
MKLLSLTYCLVGYMLIFVMNILIFLLHST